MVLYLFPEELTRIGIVSIVERTQIARTYPVSDTVFYGLPIHPTFLVEFLIMLSRHIELGPHGNHYTAVHGMDRVHHPLGVGKTFRVEFMASPRILLPVQPVDDDVVDGNPTFAEFLQGREHLLLRVVLFTTLPITHCPLRHNRALAGQCTIAADHLVHIVAIYEVIVYLVLHFAPPGEFVLLFIGHRAEHSQSAVRDLPVGFPLNL